MFLWLHDSYWKVNFGCNYITVYQTRTDPTQLWTKLTSHGASCSASKRSCCGWISLNWCWWHKNLSGKRKRFLTVSAWLGHNRTFQDCSVTNLSEKSSFWRMFCIGIVTAGWAVPDPMGCSAGPCCEQYFCQEKGTNNPGIGTVSLPLENWSHLPKVA